MSSRWSKIAVGLPFQLVGQRLDEPRATQRVSDVGHVRFVGDDLLGAQRDARRLGRRKGHRLVHRVGVQTLGAAEHAGQRLDRRAHDVDLRLLGRQRHTCGLGVEPHHLRTVIGGPIAITHPPRPDPPGSPILGDLLEEIDVGVEEEGQPRGERIHRQT